MVDNLLNPVNMAGFQTLQAVAPASQSVLSNAERYALFLADAMSQSEGGGISVSRGNIGEAMYGLASTEIEVVTLSTFHQKHWIYVTCV